MMRGRPLTRRTMRTSIAGLNILPTWWKRGAKSSTSTELPSASCSVVERIGVLVRYCCSVRTWRSMRTSVYPCGGRASPDSSALHTGSPSSRGWHHHTMPACWSTSAPVRELPISPRCSELPGGEAWAGSVIVAGPGCGIVSGVMLSGR